MCVKYKAQMLAYRAGIQTSIQMRDGVKDVSFKLWP